MKSVKTFMSPLVFAACLCVALPASAEIMTVFNNLSQPSSLSILSQIAKDAWAGQAFTTPTDHFQNATVKVNLSTTGTPTGTFEAAIYNSLSGPVIGSATSISLTGIPLTGITTASDVTLGLNLTTLDVATTYYLVLSGVGLGGSGDLIWSNSANNLQSVTGSGFSLYSSITSNAGGAWVGYTGNPQKMLIQAEIPEPASIALFAIVLAGLRFSRLKVV